MTVRSILIVCQGNICRSPMTEGFFSHQFAIHQHSLNVESAGLMAVVGHPADSLARTVMLRHGIDISRHRARQISEDSVRSADLILVMTNSQRNFLEKQFLIAKGKTFLLGYWQNFEVNDPFQHSLEVFEKVYQQIELAWLDWKTRILSCQICV